jgi:hypothetical protein
MTAVEFLIENIAHMIHSYDESELAEFYQQANEMFEQQIKDAYEKGFIRALKRTRIDAKQYYYETYKKDKK